LIDYIDNFISYLINEKDSSPLTIHKYRADLNRLINFLKTSDINQVTTDICFSLGFIFDPRRSLILSIISALVCLNTVLKTLF
jgi:hypothetical protein